MLDEPRIPPLVLLLLTDFARWYERERNDWVAAGYACGRYVHELSPKEVVSRYLDAVENHTN